MGGGTFSFFFFVTGASVLFWGSQNRSGFTSYISRIEEIEHTSQCVQSQTEDKITLSRMLYPWKMNNNHIQVGLPCGGHFFKIQFLHACTDIQ